MKKYPIDHPQYDIKFDSVKDNVVKRTGGGPISYQTCKR